MGDPKKSKRTFERPKNPWVEQRLTAERALINQFGLKNKKELWKTEAILRKKRQIARKLLAMNLEKRIQREKELIDSLKAIGVVQGNTTLDDVLGLNINDFLERRLQTIVWRKGLANTVIQSRQFITHGFIGVNGRKVNVPGFLVQKNIEDTVNYTKKPVIMERKELDKLKKGKEEKTEIKKDDSEKVEEKIEVVA